MSDIVLIPLVALVGFAGGVLWTLRVVDGAFDRFEQDHRPAYIDDFPGKAPPPPPDRD